MVRKQCKFLFETRNQNFASLRRCTQEQKLIFMYSFVYKFGIAKRLKQAFTKGVFNFLTDIACLKKPEHLRKRHVAFRKHYLPKHFLK